MAAIVTEGTSRRQRLALGRQNGEARGMAAVLLAEVMRGGRVESEHWGHVVLVSGGELVLGKGDFEAPVYCRSAVKPFQALPLFERGVVDRLALDAREIALLSASHDGTPEHVAVVAGMLAKAGLTADDLGCGPHAPFEKKSSLAIARAGEKPQRIHNNCSGKHAGFLMLADELGVDRSDYLDPESRSQRLVRDAVAEMGGVEASGLAMAIDGCGAPTIAMPLDALARGFERLVNPQALGSVRQAACGRLHQAISSEPFYLSGRQRFCAALIGALPGQVYPKNGAEGVYALGVLSGQTSYGIAIKVADGAERAYWPVVVDLLGRLGLWSQLPDGLARFAELPVHNTQKIIVGSVRSALGGLPISW